jgi:PAS domain S-box-containing protein
MLEAAKDHRESEQSTIFALEALILAALLTMVIGLLRTVRGLRRRGSRLRDAALRQEAIFEGASDAMLMLNELGNIESINAAAEHLFGYKRSEIIGQSNLILFAEPPTRKLSRAYLALLAAKNPRADQKQIFAGLSGDGSDLQAEVVTTPIRLEDGQHYLAVARDVTERLEVERMKNEFVAIVSHELRTPLTSIAGSLGLLSGGAGGDLPANAKRLIEIAYVNSERLIRLINDMLDIEKIESGQVRLDLRPISLFPLLTDVAQANQAFAERQKVTVDVKPSPPEWAVIADRDRLIQVVTNLLSNAIKFSPERSKVTVSAEQIDGHFRIKVRDHGPGIDQEFRERIFTKFAQADSTISREKGGTGLGLSIVQELVRRMNGAVGYDSEAGKGSTFHVDLPAAAKAKSAMPGARQTVHSRLSGDALPQLLHVEDDPDMLRLVESAFEGRAHVLSVASVREARGALERQCFAAVILDIAMPDGNGLDLVPRIRSSAKHVPVILFTALDAAADERKDIEARLTKSKSSLGELVMTTERLLKNRE